MAVELALPDGGEEWGEGHGVNGGGIIFAAAPTLEGVAGVAKQADVQRGAEDAASLRLQVSGLQELLERMHVKMAYASKKRA